MSSAAADIVPAGFASHYRKSPVTDPWEPLYSRTSEGCVEIGLVIGSAHRNSRGFLYGGVMAALADNAMGLSFVAARAARYGTSAQGAVTVNLALDYLATAKIGQWMCVSPRVLRASKTMGFVDALVAADGVPVARANATLRVVE